MDFDRVTMSGVMPASSNEKNATGAAAAHLDVVDDQEHVAAAAEIGQRPQPLGPRHIDAALALYRFDDHGRGLVETRTLVLEKPLEPEEVRDPAVEVVVERHRRAVHQRDLRPRPA